MKTRFVLLLGLATILFLILVGHGNSFAVVVGEWLFNNRDNPGQDTSGNGNDGMLNGGAKWTAEGRMGGAIDFNGKDAFVEIPDAKILAPMEETTVCIWVYPRSLPQEWISIFCKGGNHMDFDLLLNMNDKQAHWYVSGAVNNYNTVSQETIPLKEWTHLAATYKEKEIIEIYVNGKFSAKVAMAEQRNPSNEPVLMGKSFWPNRWFDGKMDEAYLLDEALDEEGIQKIMEKDTSPVESKGKIAVVWGSVKKLN
jgi:hypothetical protein